MKIERMKLVNHLRRIHCGGLIPQVALSGAFAASAAAPDNSALVITPGLEEAEELEEPIGVYDLGKLISALNLVSDDEIDVSINSRQRLVLGFNGARVALVTVDPGITTTSASPDLVDAVVEDANASGEGFEITPDVVNLVRDAGKLLSGQSRKEDNPAVVLLIKENVVGFRYGYSDQDQGIISLPGVTADYKEERLLFSDALLSVLGVVGDDVRLWLGNQGGFTTLESGNYRYYMSTRGKEE